MTQPDILEGTTPGPWQIVPYGDGDSLVICAPNADWRICFMATPGESPNAMARIEANARLIAASPDLARKAKVRPLNVSHFLVGPL